MYDVILSVATNFSLIFLLYYSVKKHIECNKLKDIINNSNNSVEESKDDNIIEKPDNKYIGFDIEYLSTANKYFPRYKGQYIYFWHTRENYSLQKDISGCEFGTSEEAAKRIIDRYLELQGIGSIIIPIKS